MNWWDSDPVSQGNTAVATPPQGNWWEADQVAQPAPNAPQQDPSTLHLNIPDPIPLDPTYGGRYVVSKPPESDAAIMDFAGKLDPLNLGILPMPNISLPVPSPDRKDPYTQGLMDQLNKYADDPAMQRAIRQDSVNRDVAAQNTRDQQAAEFAAYQQQQQQQQQRLSELQAERKKLIAERDELILYHTQRGELPTSADSIKRLGDLYRRRIAKVDAQLGGASLAEAEAQDQIEQHPRGFISSSVPYRAVEGAIESVGNKSKRALAGLVGGTAGLVGADGLANEMQRGRQQWLGESDAQAAEQAILNKRGWMGETVTSWFQQAGQTAGESTIVSATGGGLPAMALYFAGTEFDERLARGQSLQEAATHGAIEGAFTYLGGKVLGSGMEKLAGKLGGSAIEGTLSESLAKHLANKYPLPESLSKLIAESSTEVGEEFATEVSHWATDVYNGRQDMTWQSFWDNTKGVIGPSAIAGGFGGAMDVAHDTYRALSNRVDAVKASEILAQKVYENKNISRKDLERVGISTKGTNAAKRAQIAEQYVRDMLIGNTQHTSEIQPQDATFSYSTEAPAANIRITPTQQQGQSPLDQGFAQQSAQELLPPTAREAAGLGESQPSADPISDVINNGQNLFATKDRGKFVPNENPTDADWAKAEAEIGQKFAELKLTGGQLTDSMAGADVISDVAWKHGLDVKELYQRVTQTGQQPDTSGQVNQPLPPQPQVNEPLPAPPQESSNEGQTQTQAETQGRTQGVLESEPQSETPAAETLPPVVKRGTNSFKSINTDSLPEDMNVEIDGWNIKKNATEKQSVPAREAVKEISRDFDLYRKLMKCLG